MGEEYYKHWMKAKVPQYLVGVDPATGDFKISEYMDEHTKITAYFLEQISKVAGIPAHYLKSGHEEVKQKKQQDEREYQLQLEAFERFIREGSKPKIKEPTYDEKMNQTRYSLKDIQSLVGLLTLGIDDEKTRLEMDETFSKWREGEIAK